MRASPARRRRAGAVRWCLPFVAAMTTVAAGRCLAQPESPSPQPNPADPVQTLLADETPAELRAQAAQTLYLNDPGALAAALGPDAPDQAVIETAKAVAATPPVEAPPAPELATRLAERLDAQRPHLASAILPALGRFHDREIVRQVVAILEHAESADLRRLAMETLARQTARSDLGQDRGAWLAWWAEVQWLPENLWLRRIATAQQERAAMLEQAKDSAERRLADAKAALVAAAPDEERDAALAGLLTDALPLVRLAGLELAERSLANAQALGEPVVKALLGLLEDPEPQLRAEAASLLANIRPEGFADRLAKALRVEEDPRVAAAFLAAAPAPAPLSIVDGAVQWLDGEPPADDAAAAFLLRTARRSWLDRPRHRRGALEILRERHATLTEPMAGLLATIGEAEDHAWLERQLEVAPPERRRMFAQVLAFGSPRSAQRLAEAAASDPSLFEAAITALVRQSPTRESLEVACALPAPSEEARRTGLTRLAEALPAEALAAAAPRIEPPSLRAEVLEARLDGAPDADEAAPAGMTSLRIQLAEAWLEAGQAEDALAALPDQSSTERVLRLRALALLLSGQVEEAQAIDIGATVWLEALRLCLLHERPHADAVLEAIDARFSDELSEAESERLGALRRQMVASGEST